MAPAAVGSSEPHGQKRPAEDELQGEQPLTKRLGRLQIGTLAHHGRNGHASRPPVASTEDAQAQPDGDGDIMRVDDTKSRIFIPDLDSEIAEIESREQDERNKIEFLPEIEKKLNGFPKQLLAGNGKYSTDDSQQLVLYRVPTSLSIPQEQDSVRRAMVEARRRTKEKQTPETGAMEVEPEKEEEPIRLPWPTSNPLPDNATGTVKEDDDAMDID